MIEVTRSIDRYYVPNLPPPNLLSRAEKPNKVPNNNKRPAAAAATADDRRLLVWSVLFCVFRMRAYAYDRRGASSTDLCTDFSTRHVRERTCFYVLNLNSTGGTDELVTSSNHADSGARPASLSNQSEGIFQLTLSIMMAVIVKFVIAT